MPRIPPHCRSTGGKRLPAALTCPPVRHRQLLCTAVLLHSMHPAAFVLWQPVQLAVGASLTPPLHSLQSGLLELKEVLVPCREGALAAPGEWGQGSHAKPDWEAASMPSDRVWLGNITASATVHSVRVVFSQFGALTDAAVFPARWV